MPLMTGALPTPLHRVAAAVPFVNTSRLIGAPLSYGVVPPKLSFWLNDTYGICVSSEEAFKLAAWSVALGLPETFVLDAQIKAWAKAHRALNGAVIEDVLRQRLTDPITADDGKAYTNGPYNSVDYTNDPVLSAAIFTGKAIKIGVAHGPLSSAVDQTGMKSGWACTGVRHGGMIDHCVSLCGYGNAADLYEALKVQRPANLPASTHGYLLFTWGSIGFIDQSSMNAITGEAWVRVPATAEQPVPAPSPEPSPGPQPSPTPSPSPGGYPMTGTYSTRRQVGPFMLNETTTWTASLNDPPPAPATAPDLDDDDSPPLASDPPPMPTPEEPDNAPV
jgi:hypothetical protein